MNRVTRLAVATFTAGIAAALMALAGSPASSPEALQGSPAKITGKQVVRVTYFHTTQRCASCMKIEALSADAIRTGFERELGAGSVEWDVVNIDDAPNKHFTQDYKLYTKSVIVSDRVNGQEVRWKNLPKIWELLQNEAAFRQYVQSEVRAYLAPQS